MWGCATCGVEIGDGVYAHESETFDGTQEIVGHCFRCGRTMIVELPDLSQIPDEDVDILVDIERDQDSYEADMLNYGYDDDDMGEYPSGRLDGEII